MSEFERKPGPPAWEEGKEYACWFDSRDVCVVSKNDDEFICGDGVSLHPEDANAILWHVELPPEPPKPKRLKPGLYRVGWYVVHGKMLKDYAYVLEEGTVWLFSEDDSIGSDFQLPPGYEVLDAYAAGWEEGE